MSNSFSNVLIVDDSFVNIEFLEMFFLKYDADVTKASRPSEAFEMLEGKNYDISLVDYHMPDMDGVTFLKTLRKQGLLENLGKTYILTADVAFDPKPLGVKDMLAGYMIKPVDIDKLEKLLLP